MTMSLTPDIHFNGESVCNCCDKPMFANDRGIVFRPSSNRPDFLFCVHCAVQMTMSLAQDIDKLDPDSALGYYFKFKAKGAPVHNMRRHAVGLKKLVSKMEDHADALEKFGR